MNCFLYIIGNDICKCEKKKIFQEKLLEHLNCKTENYFQMETENGKVIHAGCTNK